MMDEEKTVEMLKALANPHRLQIFLTIRKISEIAEEGTGQDEAMPCVEVLSKQLPISQSTLSLHLKELRRAGLIRTERRGKHLYCQVNYEALSALKTLLGESPEESGEKGKK